MPLQALPDVATAYAAEGQARKRELTVGAMRLYSGISGDFTDGFVAIAPRLIEATNAAQFATAQSAAAYVPEVLAATGQAALDSPRWDIEPRQWVGTAGDGLPTESLLYGSVTRSKQAIAAGYATEEAILAGAKFLEQALSTLLADTARGVEGAATYSRPVSGWVRMLQPPSCGRCVVLAGKRYWKNQGFERHPACDCRHIPAGEALGNDLAVDTETYLSTLDEAALHKALGSRANVRAWEEYGADSRQLINAYRHGGGIRTAQVYGARVKYTLEGTTVRGIASFQMRRVRQLSAMAKDGRYRRVTAPRLMPESIFQIATSDDHAQRLLRDHGWLGARP